MTAPKPRIGIIGTGAIGGFYGVMLARAGYDVHFLLRSEYDAVVQNGLQINSAVHGSLHLDSVQAYCNVSDMPECDWVLVGAKSTSNFEMAPLIEGVAASNAKVVVLQNGLGVEDGLRNVLPDTLHLLGGLCFICVHRSALGVVEHQALGGVNLGYHSGPADSQEQQGLIEEGVAMFREAGVDSNAAANLNQARWQKLVWNMPYNGLSVLLRAGTAPLMANPDSRALVRSIMLEACGAAAACGHALPEGLVDRMMSSTDHMPDYLPSMYHDQAQGRPMELEAIYAAPLTAAAAAGFAMPKTEALYQALRFISARSVG
ncbi:putative 2-dehydropantoate 2-reductase [Stutzerimonas zhaodongensis]|uniref:2-dehydropantoate 2-reductase n=1 Tax=Stutzerimonas zhaodongensis TaxID=1176257 RepID=A0A3M2HW85_9GAMM|nr:putative 2-dehydropantoate 2-reductase [Stutzerimonas zhaodongensis]MCQ4314547.1 putative 2-dehydropantoate 2-reductase [Stutzerimonas zhaodongensis]RMH92063.1 putative 2-dehydropantoate 2-reductase [Stutzerimonas zhaodongensis]